MALLSILGGEAAGSDEGSAVQATGVCNREQLGGSISGLPAAAAAKINAELMGAGVHAALQRSHDGSSDSGRMPVHAHDAAERLEPERITQARQKLADTVLRDHVFGDGRSEHLHSPGEPRGHTSAVQRQVSES
jgi:hypothetical protein